MATINWKGDSVAVAQIINGSIDSVDGTPANNTFTVTIGGVAIDAVGDTDVATTAAALVASLNTSTYQPFAEITWTNPSAGNITGTMDTAGKSITAALTETGAGTGAVTDFTDSTANSGLHSAQDTDNYTGAALPVNSDTLVIENDNVPLKWDLEALSAVTLTELRIKANTGTAFQVGLPRTNIDSEDADTYYDEYRPEYLKVGATTANIGQGDGNGSGRIKIDGSSVQSIVNVHRTYSPAEQNIPAMLWKGTHTDNVINLYRGSLGVAYFAGETAALDAVRVSYVSNKQSDATLWIGPGVTHKAASTITQTGGTIHERSNFINLVQESGGTFYAYDAVTGTSVTIGGKFYSVTSGTITTLVVLSGGVFDKRMDNRAQTITNASVYKGGAIYDPLGAITWTNGIDLIQCGLGDVTLDLGDNLTWTPTAI